MRMLATLTATAAVAAGAVACTPAGADRQVTHLTSRHELTPAAAGAEFTREAGRLTLPAGVRWPAAPIRTTGPDGAPVRFQPGYGIQAADGYWLCAWESVAATALATARRRDVVTTMSAVRGTYLYSTSLDARGRAYVDGLVAAAGRADGRPLLSRDVADNCPVIERRSGGAA